MKPELLEHLRCPRTGQRLVLRDAVRNGDHIESGLLVSEHGEHRYPIRNSIPRFVPTSNYADNFGMQWNKFRRTQLDSFSQRPISATRFWAATGWQQTQIVDRWVLDAGCGAGRFAEVAVQAGACLVALDYSSAVDACFANLGHHPNLHIVQGDIYALPFEKRFFPFVYSLGVLQHTPDVARAVASLPAVAADGARLCVDFYERSWRSLLHPKYWLRPMTKRMDQKRLFAGLQRWVPRMLSLTRAIRRVPLVGNGLTRLVPVADYHGVLPLTEEQHFEWSLLDTFDWFAPAFDNPQDARTVSQWLQNLGVRDIEVLKAGHLVGRGIVAHAPGD